MAKLRDYILMCKAYKEDCKGCPLENSICCDSENISTEDIANMEFAVEKWKDDCIDMLIESEE